MYKMKSSKDKLTVKSGMQTSRTEYIYSSLAWLGALVEMVAEGNKSSENAIEYYE